VLLLLLLAAVVLLAVEPGRVPLFEPDEGRYSEIPREMIATGDFITPRLNGVLYFEKPPLHYWLVASSFLAFGESESAARLPTKAASIGLVLITVLFARRRYGERVALLSGLILAGSALVFGLAHITIIDPALSCALAGAVFSFAAFAEAEEKAHRAGGRSHRFAPAGLYGLHLSCAAAVMLKGLIGIVLPGGAILVWVLVTGRFRILPKLFSPGPLLLFAALAVPWHVAVARRNPDFLNFYFVHEHFDRFAKKEHHREGSPLYFVAVLLAGFLPWTAFVSRFKDVWPGWSLSALRDRATETFLFTFSVLVFLFFSVSRSKLIPYVEPIWPPLALLLAIGIERARARGAAFAGERLFTALLFGALFAAGVVYGFGAGYAGRFDIVPLAMAVLVALAAGVVLNVLPVFRREPALAIMVPWLVFSSAALACLPAVARSITPWSLVSKALSELGPTDVLVQRGHYLEVLPFYAKRLTPISSLGWSELDFGRSHVSTTDLFPTDEEFVTLWNSERRVLAVVHRDHLEDWSGPLGLSPPLELAREGNGKHILLANRK
jgi:4-amino-4-deoxy-L-arabinose transferase-like glycosyltransferase